MRTRSWPPVETMTTSDPAGTAFMNAFNPVRIQFNIGATAELESITSRIRSADGANDWAAAAAGEASSATVTAERRTRREMRISKSRKYMRARFGRRAENR